MTDTRIGVEIVADPAGVAPGVRTAETELGSLAPFIAQLNANFVALTAEVRQIGTQFVAMGEQARAGMRAAQAETEKETFLLKRMAVGVTEGVESFNRFKMMIAHVAEAYMAFFAVEALAHWAERMGEAAENVMHLKQELGLTVAQVQGLQGVAIAAGIPFEKLTKGMGILDRKFEQSPDSFRKLGVEVKNDATQMDLLLAVADRMKGMDDGPNKTALAMTLMGRSGKEMIPILNQGSAGIKELIDKTEQYGGINEAAIEKGERLAASVNESKLAFAGLKMTLMDEFAPMLERMVEGFSNLVKEMTASYQSGGLVKVAFDGVVELFQAVGEIILSVGDAFGYFFTSSAKGGVDWHAVIHEVISAVVDAIKLLIWVVMAIVQVFVDVFHGTAAYVIQWKGTLVEAFDKVVGWINITGAQFKAFAKVAYDAMTLHWSSISADWQAGMAEVDATVRREGAKIVADATRIRNQANAQLAAIGTGDAAFGKWSNDFFKPHSAGAPSGMKPLGGAGGGGAPADLTHHPKGHEKKAKDELVQQLDEELKAKQVAWAMEQDAQGTAQEYSLQSIADYWKAALGHANLSQKDRLAIEEKYLAAHSALVKEGVADEVAGYRIRLDEAKGNSAARLQLATEQAAYIGRMFRFESREYKAAQDQIVNIKREAAEQERRITDENTKAIEKIRLGEVDAAEASAQFLVQMGVRTQGQLLAQQRDFENQRFAIKQDALVRERGLVDPLRDPVAYAKISGEIESLEQQHQARLTQITRQQALQRTTMERGFINQISASWATAISRLVTLQAGLVSTIKSLYQGLQQALGSALMQVIQQWMQQHLAMLIFGRVTKSAESTAEVASNAAVAGSAAYASTAAIPIIGPMLAPASAAAAYAATMAFAPLASAARGWGNVPTDGMVTELHKEEMVLPATIATPLRGMLSTMASWHLGSTGLATRPAQQLFDSSGPAGAAREGDVHLHLRAMDGRSARRFLIDRRSDLADVLRSAARDNV